MTGALIQKLHFYWCNSCDSLDVRPFVKEGRIDMQPRIKDGIAGRDVSYYYQNVQYIMHAPFGCESQWDIYENTRTLLSDPHSPNFAKKHHKCYQSFGQRPEETKTETVRSKYLFKKKEKSIPPRESHIQNKMREIRRQRLAEFSENNFN